MVRVTWHFFQSLNSKVNFIDWFFLSLVWRNFVGQWVYLLLCSYFYCVLSLQISSRQDKMGKEWRRVGWSRSLVHFWWDEETTYYINNWSEWPQKTGFILKTYFLFPFFQKMIHSITQSEISEKGFCVLRVAVWCEMLWSRNKKRA